MKTAFKFTAPYAGIPQGFDEAFEPGQIVLLETGDPSEKAFTTSEHFKRLEARELDAYLRDTGEPENTLDDGSALTAEVTRLTGALETADGDKAKHEAEVKRLTDLLETAEKDKTAQSAEVTRLTGALETADGAMKKITDLLEVEAKDVFKTVKKLLKPVGE